MEGDYTPYGQKLRNVTVKECWSHLMKQSDFECRRLVVDEFNKYAFCILFTVMMTMMKLPILLCAEKLELVLSTAPRT